MGRLPLIVIVIALVATLPLARGRTFPLSAAVRYALRHSSAQALARARQAQARAALRAAQSEGSVRATASYGYLFSDNPLLALSAELERRQVSAQAFTPSTLNSPGVRRLGTASLSLAWPLYEGGAIHDAVRAGRFAKQAAGRAGARTRQRIVATVVTAYEGLVMAKAGVRVARGAVAVAARHAHTTRRLYARGRILHSDALTAAVNLGAAREFLLGAQNDVANARTDLALAMGAPAGLAIHIPAQTFGPVAMPRRPLRQLLRVALRHRADVAALRAKIRALRAQGAAARGRSSLHVTLTAQSQWFSRVPTFRHNAWTVGAVISKSLYDGGHNGDRAAELEARAAETEAALTGLEDRIRRSVVTAYDALYNAAQRLILARATVQRARRNVALVQVLYGEGRTILLNLLNADQGLVKAREDELAARYALARNRAALADACGTLSPATLPALGLKP